MEGTRLPVVVVGQEPPEKTLDIQDIMREILSRMSGNQQLVLVEHMLLKHRHDTQVTFTSSKKPKV